MFSDSGSTDATTAAFEVVYQQSLSRVRRFVARYERDPDEQDDLVQEVWIRGLVSYPSYRGGGSLEGWLLRVARTVCVDHCRTRSKRGRDWARYAPALADDLDERLPEAVAVERALRRQEMCDRATDLVLALPERERAVALFRLMLGRSTAEVATTLGMAPGTVKATLHHATTKLRRAVQSAGAPQS